MDETCLGEVKSIPLEPEKKNNHLVTLQYISSAFVILSLTLIIWHGWNWHRAINIYVPSSSEYWPSPYYETEMSFRNFVFSGFVRSGRALDVDPSNQ